MAIACIHRQHLIFHKSIKYDDYPDQGSIIGDQAEEHVVNELKFENTLKMAGTFRKKPFKAIIWQT